MLRLFRQYYPIRNLFFVLGEFAVIFLSTLYANWIFLGVEQVVGHWALYSKILVITVIIQTCLYYNDLYDFQVTDSFGELSVRLLQALGAAAIVLAGIYLVVPEISMGMEVFTLSIGFVILFIVSWRFGYAILLNRRWFDQRILIFGFNPLTANILKEITERRDCGYVVDAVVLAEGTSPPEKHREDLSRGFFLEYPQEGLCHYAESENIQKIVVGIQDRDEKFPVQELLHCRIQGIEVIEGSTFFEMLTGKLLVDHIKPEWLIFSEGFQKSWSKRIIKRAIDLILSSVMLVLLLPLILVISVLIKLDRKEPEISAKDIWCSFPRFCEAEQVIPSERIRFLLRDYLQFEGENSFGLLWKQFKEKCVKEEIPFAKKLLNLIHAHMESVHSADQKSRRPVFFSQERMGQDGKTYQVRKFRSMVVNAERYSGPDRKSVV